MDDSASNAKARPLHTWSVFGEIRRMPSEYEIVTHEVNYTLRKRRTAAFELNPTTPANMWYLTYRDKSPVQVAEWNEFRDPDEMTYRKYVTTQDEQESVMKGVLDQYERTAHDSDISARWLDTLARVLIPTRYPVHGLQMTQAYLGTIAPSSYITNCAAFAAGDLLRRGSLIAYRTRQLQLARPDVHVLVEARRIWEADLGWQPARKALETALITYDWAECLTAVNLVLRPALDEVLLAQLANVARKNRDDLTWLLLTNLAMDSARAARWSCALARFAIARNPDNVGSFARWVKKWRARAEDAAGGLATLLTSVSSPGQEELKTLEAARNAIAASLEAAGISADLDKTVVAANRPTKSSAAPQYMAPLLSDPLIALFDKYAVAPGANPCRWTGLTFYRFESPVAPHWDQTASLAFCIVVQGRKRVTINGRKYFFDPANYFLINRATRLQAEILEGSPAQPFLSMILQIPAAAVAEVLIESLPGLQAQAGADDEEEEAYVSKFDGDLRDAVLRFLKTLDDDSERRLLGPLFLREIVFRLLRHDQAPRLVTAALYGKTSRKVFAAIRYMQSEFDKSITIDDIARAVGASTSTLAHSFKEIIGVSPYHFLKQLRLERARVLMIREGWGVSEAAARTGYASPSHFVKAFTSYFGEAPSQYANQFRGKPTLNVMETTETRT
ncbi:AraC family transcriptional regulator N-terminal domain-containing protein [Paraburkholderia sp. CNPSo 3274]|uniref:AraC family transcriptional regulator N-terminal domain-containing protein n=1 Tax=Paraburkholderia sp. CNPSo 3274 TaxID=2940932 RepID=UPI0020B811D2|nr:AraC family transcriptional regulator N-terminal domain-containing protein [Paraburkholderia sp. CNPSo 3274]MCP3709301.1 AraC family transcriptional regulator N-terminal domain-containing protein [Paraburkholderia sp. CNPSo 3274]